MGKAGIQSGNEFNKYQTAMIKEDANNENPENVFMKTL